MELRFLLCFFLFPLIRHAAAEIQASAAADGGSTIVFATLGRPDYAFDIYALPARDPPTQSKELRLTDGRSVNYNGHFPQRSAASLLSILPNRTLIEAAGSGISPSLEVIYVTDRNGTFSIYYDVVYGDSWREPRRRRAALETAGRVQIALLEDEKGVSMKDRPSLVGDRLIYVSTHEDSGEPRTSWTAVYWTELATGLTRRLTPAGIADYSPAVSPSGTWTAVASYGEKGWGGEVEELGTDIYVFLTRDGNQRVKVVDHGGWPCWVDDSTLFFHRRGDDGWWSVYRAILPSRGNILSSDTVVTQRVTPPGLHAFTPATSPGNTEFIAVATRRPGSEFRHVEIFDLVKGEFRELTRPVSARTHHLNPFISADSQLIGYHRCRGQPNGPENPSPHLLLENLRSPVPGISLFRMDGSFPSFSPDGARVVYVNFPGVYVVNRDGSGRREVYSGIAFSTAWDTVRPGVVYVATGPTFATESTHVDIVSIDVDDPNGPTTRKLTSDGKNNAFPALSPDGQRLVFRSGRSGHKNLYIMDPSKGDAGGLERLTEGPWTDTMCAWSPDGDWIAFASDRENPGSGSFEVFLIHPNGTGLRKLIQSGLGGRANHPYFSPDGERIVFTSDYGAVSAEPISNMHHYQPYGEIFTVRLDGSDVRRLTHNSYEDGTPTWVRAFVEPRSVEWTGFESPCAFEDCHWLSKMPSGKGGGAPTNLTMAQCAGTGNN